MLQTAFSFLPEVDDAPWMKYTQGQSLIVDGAFESVIDSRGDKTPRITRTGDAVSCYRNLNKFAQMMFSVKQDAGELKNKVTGYAKVFVIAGTPENPLRVKISEAGRLRVNREKRKNVHSSINGIVLDAYNQPLTLNALNKLDVLTYNPYLSPYFYRVSDGKTFDGELPYQYAMVCGANVYCF